MRILCLMQFVPIRDGVGGSQRAWFLLQSLAELGEVDLVILHPDNGLTPTAEQDEAIRSLARTLTVLAVPGWKRSSDRSRLVHRRLGGWFDYLRVGSIHAPRLSEPDLRLLAAGLPARSYDMVFAARLPSAVMIDALIRRGLLGASRKVVDFDDVLSKFFAREASTFGWRKFDRKLGKVLDVSKMEEAENALLRSWDGVSVCSAQDVAELIARVPASIVHEVPNVVDRPFLPPSEKADFRILFVGNLGFGPNEQGLHRFLEEAWPAVRERMPVARLVVVGFSPKDALRDKIARLGGELHSNVPSVVPYYQDAHAVIAPIFFGGGTRIKLLEAMAFGRAIVATPIGAEGLSLVHGRHAMIAEGMDDFADALVRIGEDEPLRATLARNAREHQQATFGPPKMLAAIRGLASLSVADMSRRTASGDLSPAVSTVPESAREPV